MEGKGEDSVGDVMMVGEAWEFVLEAD